MKLAIDATNTGPGGGLTVLIKYVQEWVNAGEPEEIIVFASRPAVIQAVQAIKGNVRVIPFMQGESSIKVFLAGQILLARQIAKEKADVVMTTGRMLHHCSVPQLVHHQNLWRQVLTPFREKAKEVGIKAAIKFHIRKKEYFYALKHAAANTFISDYMCNLANEQYSPSSQRNYSVRNGGIESALGEDEKQSRIQSKRPPVIVAVQSHGPHKQSDLLLYMLKHLKAEAPHVPWKLVLIGTVYNPANFQNLMDKLDCRENVEMPGYLPLEKIYEHFSGALCHVLPSRLEGFGITALEAMAMGCPVVASDCTAIPEVVGDAGILVSPDDPKAFATAVLSIYNDESFRKSCIERGFCQIQKFSWKESAQKMLELFKKIQCPV